MSDERISLCANYQVANRLFQRRRNGHFTGFPQLGVRWQRMESAALKASHGMTAGQKGVLVRSVAPLADAARVLQPGDVIMKFDGIQVASDGTVPFRHAPVIQFAVHWRH